MSITKSERLLREIKLRKGMTHGECVQFLLDLRDGFGNTVYDSNKDQGLYSALLYGTRNRTGLFEKYCEQDSEGRYHVVRTITGPFTEGRRTFTVATPTTNTTRRWPAQRRSNAWPVSDYL